MRPQLMTNLATYGLLGTAVAVSALLPARLGPRSTQASPPSITGATTLDLTGVVRDFKSGHPDFKPGISGANGHSAGNTLKDLGSTGRPVFGGYTGGPANAFGISDGAALPDNSAAPMITILGSEVTYNGTYDCPVTVQLHFGSQTITPWGAYDKALAGNVNKSGNPRKYAHSSALTAKTPIWIDGRVWTKKSSGLSGNNESDWQIYSTFSSRPSNVNVKVLRNGDTVPTASGFSGQLSVHAFLDSFVDIINKKVKLKSNQAIYLFEFASATSSAADWQDLVVLVTLGTTSSYVNVLDAVGNVPPGTSPKGYKVTTQWRDKNSNPIAPNLMGTATGDIAGTKGAATTGGIYSAQTYDQWFGDVMGTNLSTQSTITLTKNASGVWEYLTNAFHPIDGQLFGNEGKSHNHYFTFAITAQFTHHAGEHRFFEFQGDDDMWVFVNGKLAMDLGGIAPGLRQYLDVDRLGLSDGQQHTINFFYAQRQETTANFNLRTNLDLGVGTTQVYTVSQIAD